MPTTRALDQLGRPIPLVSLVVPRIGGMIAHHRSGVAPVCNQVACQRRLVPRSCAAVTSGRSLIAEVGGVVTLGPRFIPMGWAGRAAAGLGAAAS